MTTRGVRKHLATTAAMATLMAACASTPAARAPTSVTAPPPSGWWIVESASREDAAKPGTAWRFQAAEYQMVHAPDFVDRQKTALRPSGEPETWIATEPAHYTVHVAGALLTLTTTVPAPPITVTLRVAKPDESAAAEAALAAHGTLDKACTRAARCFRDAAVALSPTHDDKREMAEGTSLRQCELITADFVSMFTRMQRPVPGGCVE